MPLQPKRAKIVLISVGALAGLTLLAWVGFNVLLGSPEAEAEFTASETLPGAGGNDSEKGDSQDGEEDQMTPPQGTWEVSIEGTGDSAVGYRILEDVPVGGPEEMGTVDTTLSTFGVTRPDLLGRTARDEVVVEFKLQFVPQPA